MTKVIDIKRALNESSCISDAEKRGFLRATECALSVHRSSCFYSSLRHRGSALSSNLYGILCAIQFTDQAKRWER